MFNSLVEWFDSHKEYLFDLWVYKRKYTPYEKDKRFEDQCVYENSRADTVKIVEVIPLPDNDVLLGCRSYDCIDDKFFNRIDYYKLSEIRLSKICKIGENLFKMYEEE